jgi:DNA primase
VEGPFDAMAVTLARGGRFAGVAPCGTALTSEQLAALGHLVDLRERGVLVGFDPDRAGLRAAVRAYHLLRPFTGKMATVRLPVGQDPAQILQERGPAALAEILTHAHPLADVVVDAEVDRWSRWLVHPEGRINALRAAAPIVAAMPPAHVGRQVARLAERLDLEHALVTGAVTDAVPEVIAGPSNAPWRREAAPPQLTPASADGKGVTPGQSSRASARTVELPARRVTG